MRKGVGGALLTIAVLGLSLLTGPASAIPQSDDVGVQERPGVRPVLWCFEPADSNCIESLEYQVSGTWQTATVAEVVDWGGKPIAVLNTPGLAHEAGRNQVVAEAFESDVINGPEFPAYQFQLQSWPQGTDGVWDPPINRCEGGDPSKPTGKEPCWRAPWLAQTQYRLTLRTTALVPIFAQTSLVEMQTVITEIPGGRRISLAGKPGPSQWVLDYEVADKNDQFDAVTFEWGGFLSDARARNGALAECQGLGIASAYSNGNGGQMPEWDSRTGTLSFGTGGFHYAPDGSVYKGLAEIFVPGPLARCMWKVDPRQTTRMEIEVFTDGGGEETAGTKSIAYDAAADLVKMIAIDFTYSQKQIAARPTPVTAAPGKKACDVTNTVCVTVDRSRKSAKVSVAKITGASEVLAVALRGTSEDGPQVKAPVKKGKASLTVKLAGAKSKGQIWVVRTPSTFISSFQVG